MKDQYLIVDGSFLHKNKCHRHCIQCSNKKYNIRIDSVVFHNTIKINVIHFKNKKVHIMCKDTQEFLGILKYPAFI